MMEKGDGIISNRKGNKELDFKKHVIALLKEKEISAGNDMGLKATIGMAIIILQKNPDKNNIFDISQPKKAKVAKS
jgi:hypothetical protein